jgi:hypothetical protein
MDLLAYKCVFFPVAYFLLNPEMCDSQKEKEKHICCEHTIPLFLQELF